MLGFVPKREQEGKGERKTCISILFALLGKFDEKETAQICQEAGWSSEFWDPIKEIPTCYEPSNSIGTLVHHARQGGWVHPDDRGKIKLEMLFPPDLVEALRVVTKYLPYPDVLVATTYLAGLSGLLRLGSRINLFPGSDFVVPLNLYVATVGKTGSKKSPLQRALIDSPLQDIKGELRRGWQQILGNWLKRKANDDEDAGPRPEQPLLIVKDITGEALEQQLKIQEKQRLGLLLCRDELAGVFKGFGRYTQGRGSEQEQLLELYDGGGFSTLRKKELRFCEKTHLSVYGGIQPEVLAELQQGKDHNGQWARFLFSPLIAKPTRLATRFPASEQKEFEKAKGKLKEVARRVRDIPAFEHQVSNEFLEGFAEYEYGKQCKAVEAKRPSHAAILNKSAGKVGRVAGLLHLLHLPGCPETPDDMGRVGVESLNGAIALVDYLDNYAMKFQTDTTRSELEKWMKRLHLIAAKAKSPMAWHEIQKQLSGQERNKLTKELKVQAFNQLEEAGLGILSTGPQGGLKYNANHPWPDDA